MELNVRHNLLRYAATIFIGFSLSGTAYSQTPTPAAPVSVTDPSLNDPITQALEPVRQAIARQDYQAAEQALEAVRQQDPTHPGIALYENMIQRRQGQGQAVDTQSPLRTPRPGVTPLPVADPTPEPEATPAPEQASQPAPAAPAAAGEPAPAAPDDSMMGKATALWENEMVRYAVYGLAALLALLIIFSLFKKRRDATSDDEEENSADESFNSGVTTMGGLDDHLADEDEMHGSFGTSGRGPGSTSMAGGLSGSSSMDFGLDNQQTAQAGGPSTGGLSGSALSGGMAGYTMPTFGGEDEEDEAPAPPPQRPQPSKPVDDDGPVSFASMQEQEDEPAEPTPAAATPPPAAAEPKAVSDDVSFESLGINFGGSASDEPEEPKAPTPFHEEETMILSAEDDVSSQAPPPMSTTPTSTPPSGSSLSAPGTVDLEDIFGSQPLPGAGGPDNTIKEPNQPSNSLQQSAQPSLHEPAEPAGKLPADDGEDENSNTLPTFVSAPGSDNPEDDAEMPPPPARTRPTADQNSETDSISFEELFGSSKETVATPAPENATPTPAPKAKPEPEPEPEPAPAKPVSEMSIEDALAATLGDMQNQSPDAAPGPEPSAAEVVGGSSESLDERTERMFREQMEKARAAYGDKNWRQAVHFLSIASALHPENDEAKQMLKDARAEKRKSEESV